jgi:hypothetical protein
VTGVSFLWNGTGPGCLPSKKTDSKTEPAYIIRQYYNPLVFIIPIITNRREYPSDHDSTVLKTIDSKYTQCS